MIPTTRTSLAILLLLSLSASARDVTSPNGAWSMKLPDVWEPASREVYERIQQPGVHAVFQAPEEGKEKFRDYLVVTVIEQPMNVTAAGREEFRAKLQADLEKSSVQSGIERVLVEKLGDRDVYRVEGFFLMPESAPLKNAKWYIPAGDKTYVFSFTCTAATFNSKLLAFESMAESIRMREEASAAPTAGSDWSSVVTWAGIAVVVLAAAGIVFVLRKSATAGTEP